jgi:UPF0755 protein
MHMKRQFPLFLAFSAVLVLVYGIVQFAIPVNSKKEPEEIYIKEGTNFSQAASMLAKKGYLRDAALFKVLGRLTGADRRMRAGYYAVEGSMTPWAIFRQFSGGKLIETEVTIIEGECLPEIRDKLAAKKLVSAEDFDRLTTDPSFIDSLGVEGPTLEGYLFPDTYRFPKGITPKKLISTMVQRLEQEYEGTLMERTNELGLSMRAVLTMASIIEKEAVVDSERTLVAAVFFNRLKKGMPLQADPTAVYGVKPPRALVSKQDLIKKTKYNTYQIKGLPPGPIASPGLKSIKAALYPARVPYLYFVSNHDGTHTFSATYEEHLRAVENLKSRIEEEELAKGAEPEPEQEKMEAKKVNGR